MRRMAISAWAGVIVGLLVGNALAKATTSDLPGGELKILKEGKVTGICPLKHTDVKADIAGYVARVKVKQVFQNPGNEKIEAVYTFPLPQDSAVDDMVMTVGERRIVGQIKKREEAKAIYEKARAEGHVASLLDQERPNIFTQAVANIEPGAEVIIEIGYVDTLKFEEGTFEFVFPMVVGPRYMPGSPMGKQGTGMAPDTTSVPDASKISPPVTPEGTRAGHDISLSVNIDAGMPIGKIESTSHEINVNKAGEATATIALKNAETIPNKDFILRYQTATDKITDAFLVHKDERGRFFTLILQPPKRVERKEAVPRELIFVLDTSGSMHGFPIEKAKEVMSKAIDTMGEKDTFNLITFSGDTHILWPEPKPATKENRQEAQAFLASRQGRGGTEMMKAIDAALRVPDRDHKGVASIRVVCFMTDGFVGNDMEIIDAVKTNAGTTRVFSFGIGQSVNRFLLDGMAQAGRGEVEYVQLESKADEAVQRFAQRIDAPVLTDIKLDWGKAPVADVYPTLVPDLWSAKPIMIKGRLTGDPAGTITLRGTTAAGPFERKIDLSAEKPGANDGLASLWARSKVGELMMQDYAKLQQNNFPEDLKNQITALGIEFRLMTQFTSFVAVEEKRITEGGVAKTVAVPVEMPEGVSYEGVFGDKKDGQMAQWGGGGVGGGRASGGFAYSRMAPNAQAMPMRGAGQRAQNGDAAKAAEAPLLVNGPATRPAATQPLSKLDPALQGLAEKVLKNGKDGSLTVGQLHVTNYRVKVSIALSVPASREFLIRLARLGFEHAETGELRPRPTTGSAESNALEETMRRRRMAENTSTVVGSIDVRKLEELAKLPEVVSIKPMEK